MYTETAQPIVLIINTVLLSYVNILNMDIPWKAFVHKMQIILVKIMKANLLSAPH